MKLLINLFLFLPVILTTAQDSLVRISEVRFISKFEEKAVKEYLVGRNPETLYLFLSLNTSASSSSSNQIRVKINQLVDEINASNILTKKPQRQVKDVYKKIHDSFLRKYETENRFHEIFETGNYNCVTATALYSIIFDQLKIPYAIKEEPTHVYLVAYPNESNILVETTTPASGYMTFDQVYKNNFVNNLKNQKIIGKGEFESNNTDQLFNKYFFSTEDIDLKKLVGIHYMNDAIFLQEKGKRLESFEQAEKAYLFYPSKKSQHLIASFGALLVSETQLKPIEKSKIVTKLSRYKSMGITNEMIKGEFVGITQDVLVKDNDKELYRQCYDIFRNGLDDKEMINDISYYFNYENARIFYNQGNFERALYYFKKALEIQPNNVDLGLIFSQCLSQTFGLYESNSTVVDTINHYQNQFPALMEIQNFKYMLAKAYLFEFQSNYDKGKPSQGDKYKSLFETLIQNDNKLYIHHDLIGSAYSTACTYYFKKGQKGKAKEFVSKGLEFAPGSYELRARQQMLSR